jgi:hypothetical protein
LKHDLILSWFMSAYQYMNHLQGKTRVWQGKRCQLLPERLVLGGLVRHRCIEAGKAKKERGEHIGPPREIAENVVIFMQLQLL